MSREPLKADRELWLEAVRQNGSALVFAAGPLKADRELVLEAVRQDGGALRYAADQLKADPLLTESSVAANPFAVHGAASPVCAVVELKAFETGIRYEAAWGLGGATLSGQLGAPHSLSAPRIRGRAGPARAVHRQLRVRPACCARY